MDHIKHCLSCGAVLPLKKRNFCGRTCWTEYRKTHQRTKPYDSYFIRFDERIEPHIQHMSYEILSSRMHNGLGNVCAICDTDVHYLESFMTVTDNNIVHIQCYYYKHVKPKACPTCGQLMTFNKTRNLFHCTNESCSVIAMKLNGEVKQAAYA
jgi:RNA polymerase subunit RPABC4/transcription elongation factor Spt4